MKWAKISVIVPIHNTERYLSGCLNSITAQTYRNLEIILVDNGSTDGSGTICDKYAAKDGRIRVIHKQEGGVSSARNMGLAAATGDYIGWVDSDDWIESDMFEYLLKNVLRYKADIAVCGWYEHHEGRGEARSWQRPELLDTGQALGALLEDSMMGNYLWNKLWRAGLFEGIRFPKERRYEDVAVAYRLLAQAETVACLPEAKYHYRRHMGNLTGDKSLGAEIDYFLAVKERYEWLAPAWPQYEGRMEGQVVSAAVKLWSIYFDNPRSERVKNTERLKQAAQFTKAHRRGGLRNMELGLAGRILTRLTGYAAGWSFALAWWINFLLQLKQNR